MMHGAYNVILVPETFVSLTDPNSDYFRAGDYRGAQCAFCGVEIEVSKGNLDCFQPLKLYECWVKKICV